MSYGSTDIYQVLDADAAVAAEVSLYGAGEKMIFVDNVLPDTIVGNDDRTINIYPVGFFDNRLEYGQYRWTVSCRGPSYEAADKTALAVVEALNRKASGGDAFFVTIVNTVIPPADGTDNYQVPVEVTIKLRR